MSVVTRFAPSPTGNLHIGGARTALYSYLFARHCGGKFILRIEDTDVERSKPEYVDDIIEVMRWLGLDYDEIYYQSKRLDIYREYAEKLLSTGRAYKRLDPGKGEGIVFKIDRDYVYWDDVVHGRIGRDISKDPDLVIYKSDGYPTYNFACVVDDMLTGVTHVIRGNDHIPNTPKQISLFRALGAEAPVFAHIPLILNPDLSKMSKDYKKSGKESSEPAIETAALKYREEGFLPEAINNFLALLGWSPGNDLEIMDMKTLVSLFSLERVNKKSAVFDMKKLLWLNSHYIRNKPLDDLAVICKEYLAADNELSAIDFQTLKELVRQNQERLKTLNDLEGQIRFVLDDCLRYDEDAVSKYVKNNLSRDILRELGRRFSALGNFSKEEIYKILKELEVKFNVKFIGVAQPLRVALTGGTVSPPIDETAAVLGKSKVLARIERALSL